MHAMRAQRRRQREPELEVLSTAHGPPAQQLVETESAGVPILTFRHAPAVSFRVSGGHLHAVQSGWSEAVSALSAPPSAQGLRSRVGDGPPCIRCRLLPGGRARDAPARSARPGPSGLPAV
jgi:hypothetical protein